MSEINKLLAVAEAVGLDASQGAILHRSHRGHWEIHGRFINSKGRGVRREVLLFPWEGSHTRNPSDTDNGARNIPLLEGVEDPDMAMKIIADHVLGKSEGEQERRIDFLLRLSDKDRKAVEDKEKFGHFSDLIRTHLSPGFVPKSLPVRLAHRIVPETKKEGEE